MFSFLHDKNSVKISPSIVVFTVFFLLGLYFLYYIRPILILLFLAFIIMVALNPAVTALQNRVRLPRVLATLLVYFWVLACLVGVIALVIPPLTRELYQLVVTLNLPPQIQTQMDNFDFNNFNFDNISGLASQIGNSVNVIFSVLSSTFSGLFTFFTLIVLSFYLMLERPSLYKKALWFTKDENHIENTRKFIDSIEYQLGGWVRGQLVLMLVIGFVTYIGLTLLGIPYALPLALIAGLLEIVPNIGPTIASIPAIIFGFLYGGPIVGAATIVFYVIIQQLENNLIVPKIMKDSVDVNPLVAIVTILIGLKLGGVVGALLAVPVYIMCRTLYSMWYHQKLAKKA